MVGEGRGVAAGASVPALCSQQQESEPHSFTVPWGWGWGWRWGGGGGGVNLVKTQVAELEIH